jgi:hypothetical protein
MDTLICSSCKQEKPTTEFYKLKSVKRGYSYHCGACSRSKDAVLRSKPGYSSFHSAKTRCNNPEVSSYKWYGGRGISYDPDLFQSYETFWAGVGHLYESAEKEYPGEALTIDRINNDGDYTVENIRFVPRYINENNRSDNYYIKWKGVNQSATMWAKQFGIPPGSLIKRHKSGWSMNLIELVPNDTLLVQAIQKQIRMTRNRAINEIKKAITHIEKPHRELTVKEKRHNESITNS